MIEFPKLMILGTLIVLVSVFLYPVSENLVYLSLAAFGIATVITLLASRETLGLVLLIFIISFVAVTALFGNIFFGILVGSIVAIVFVTLDILFF